MEPSVTAPSLRVLLIDDSAVFRRIVSDILQRDGTLEVSAPTSFGKLTMERAFRTAPHVIVFGSEKPKQQTIEALRDLKSRYPTLPVVVCGANSDRSAAPILGDLKPVSFVDRPGRWTKVSDISETFSGELLAAVKSVAVSLAPERVPMPEPRRIPELQQIPASQGRQVALIVIGTGQNFEDALIELIKRLKGKGTPPIVVASQFVTRIKNPLEKFAALGDVLPVSDGTLLTPGSIYLLPSGNRLDVAESREGLRMSIRTGTADESYLDRLFLSLAANLGQNLVAVALPGTGRAGLTGIEAVMREGGITCVQTEASNSVRGVTKVFLRVGGVVKVLPLSAVGKEIVNACAGAVPNRIENTASGVGETL